MPYTPNTTWVDGSGGGTPLSAARLNNLESGVTMTFDTYTPTWTSTGSAPSIGNGTLSGRYMQRGKFVFAYGRVVFGTTTTAGTGSYTWALPVTASTTSQLVIGTARVIDSSAGFMSMGSVRLPGSATLMDVLYQTALNGGYSGLGATTPFTLANTDTIDWQIMYEAA